MTEGFMLPTSQLYDKITAGESVFQPDDAQKQKIKELAKSTGFSEDEIKKSIELFGYDWTKDNIGTKERESK